MGAAVLGCQRWRADHSIMDGSKVQRVEATTDPGLLEFMSTGVVYGAIGSGVTGLLAGVVSP